MPRHLSSISPHGILNFQSPNRSPKKSNIPSDIDSPPFYIPLRSFKDRYKVIGCLGNGSFGTVSLAKIGVDLNNTSSFKIFRNTLLERNSSFLYENVHNKKSRLVAIKTMNKRLPLLHDYTRIQEIRFLLSIPYHRNLVQVYEIFIDNTDFKLHTVMECMDQNLYQLMKARKGNYFSSNTIKSLLSQILNGIRHIHRHDYFHRDVKPENILVTPSNRYFDSDYLSSDLFKYHDNFIVKLADYGLARHVQNRRPYTSYVSTRWYRAPEILLRKEGYSRPVDIWAFGSVAAEIVTLRPLFPGSNELEQTWKVLDVLGTPLSRNEFENYTPSYGYWDEAVYLSRQLGLQFPKKRCIDISFIINNPLLGDMCDVIRNCLYWDPNERADVDTICSMPYFRDTCVDEGHTLKPQSITTNPPLGTFNRKTSERLIGLPHSKNSLEKTLNRMSLNLTDAKSTSLNDIDNSVDHQAFGGAYFSDNFNYSYQQAASGPSNQSLHVNQGVSPINDENINSFVGALSIKSHTGANLMKARWKGHTDDHELSSIPLNIDLNTSVAETSRDQRSLNENFFQDQFDLLFPDFRDENTDSLTAEVLHSDDFIDWSAVARNDDILEYESNSNSGFREKISRTHDSSVADTDIANVFENIDALHNQSLNDSDFTDQIYSRFNLRKNATNSQIDSSYLLYNDSSTDPYS